MGCENWTKASASEDSQHALRGPWLQGMYVWPWNGMVLLVQACWICPMHGCAVFAHTHALTQHITVTYIASPIPSLSAPVFRSRPTNSSPSRGELLHLNKTNVLPNLHRPMRISPFPCPANVLPVSTPGLRGQPVHTPRPDQASHRHGLVSPWQRGPPAAPAGVRYSRSVNRSGTRIQ
jgi:hypothetical protein